MVLIRATGKSFLKRPQLDYGPSQAPLHRRGLFSKTISHSNFMIQGAQKHVDVPLVVSPVKRLQETPYIIDQIKDGQLVISFISRIVKRGQVRQNKNQTTRCVVKHV